MIDLGDVPRQRLKVPIALLIQPLLHVLLIEELFDTLVLVLKRDVEDVSLLLVVLCLLLQVR